MAVSSDVIKAATWIRDSLDRSGCFTSWDDAVRLLAEAVLKSQRDDDDVLATEAWIREVIPPTPAREGYGGVGSDLGEITWRRGNFGFYVWINADTVPFERMTRRQFRSLATGFGVDLSEAK